MNWDAIGAVGELLGSTAFTDSKQFIPTGWDAHSVEADPQLDSAHRPAPTGPAATGAVTLPAEFPGRGDTFRGALPPAGTPSDDMVPPGAPTGLTVR